MSMNVIGGEEILQLELAAFIKLLSVWSER
ncbi:hypothetical protein SDC9_02711 [bioreactor metagenome]|uniref:Uncharacterized protein n=1 Tax=bioreactor metagenome TaxID=1076179 RepID=A0A644SRG2_9ZZZZ